jgi:hypothetical protein
MSTYRAFDQHEKLGPPPWRADDPALLRWETAHGHDVRLKCSPEYGCRLTNPAERMASPWPPPADLHDVATIARFRPGGRALRTVWLVRRDGTEYFIGHLDTPELVELTCQALNRYLSQMRAQQR